MSKMSRGPQQTLTYKHTGMQTHTDTHAHTQKVGYMHTQAHRHTGTHMCTHTRHMEGDP